jgi:hypothetical protein
LAKPITYFVEHVASKWPVPALFIFFCFTSAASHLTALNGLGIVGGVIWLRFALRSRSSRETEYRREDGLTLAMAREMNRTLVDAQKRSPTEKQKVGGREIFERITNGLKDERGVHVESQLACLGALAGYACQFSVREQSIKSGAKSPDIGFSIVTGADGRNYYFGGPLNKPLAEDKYSVWSLTAGAVKELGKPLPDLMNILKHAAATVGGAKFGIPRIPEGHGTGDLPIHYLKAVWPQILPIAQRFCDEPAQLPVVFGLAIQHTIIAAKDAIDPTLAGTIVMECAVPMSKVDLARS